MPALSSPLLVQTTFGPILGFQDTFDFADASHAPSALRGEEGGKPPVAKWLGIPYGQAERWKRCTPCTAWEKPLECYDFGTVFPAPEDTNGDILFTNNGIPHRGSRLPSSEDSFLTHVYAPGDYKPGEKLPVLAWIHGGGLIFGTSCNIVNDPTRFIRKQAERGRRVIVVAANYRLNVFGFLNCLDLAEEADGKAVGNFGLYDCVAWLEWVRGNIAAFGGDPDNVTIYGESAGAVLCNSLCLHPARLFKRAILQSGAASTIPPITVAEADQTYLNLLATHGITAKTHPTPASRLEALRELDAQTVMSGFDGIPPRASRLCIEHGEGAIYVDHPVTMIEAGKMNPYVEAIFLGSMMEEGRLFEHVFPPPSHGFVLSAFPHAAAEIKEHYIGTSGENWDSLPSAEMISDCLFLAPIDELADALVDSGVQVHRYSIETRIAMMNKHVDLGACHSVSLPFLFDVDLLWSGKETSVEGKSATNISNMVAMFGMSGETAPGWSSYSANDPQALIFTAEGATAIQPYDTRSTHRLFWRGIHSNVVSSMRGRRESVETKSWDGGAALIPSEANGVQRDGVKTRYHLGSIREIGMGYSVSLPVTPFIGPPFETNQWLPSRRTHGPISSCKSLETGL